MVRDGYYYALGMLIAALLVGWLAGPLWAVLPLALGAFFLWFFRDPERVIPTAPGAIVSPGDGRVTEVATIEIEGQPRTRISIFLSVFDVHVNRSPIAGVIRKVEYRKGLFKNALGASSAASNEQNIVTVDDGSQTVAFKQIAGLIARRIVFTKKIGDSLARGERVGMIKFGSRVDVLFDPAAAVQVKVGQHVAGGSTILALAPVAVAQDPHLPKSGRCGAPPQSPTQSELAAPKGGHA
jgi:phosphatidylserine decarboxylase